jgi:hypothetical protein
MTRGRLVVHAHFYQPTRIDPFTGDLPADASAAPHRDWNARITEECYRPNAENGALARASWDLGPTLSHYLAGAAPDVLDRFAESDRRGGGREEGPGIAQAFHHSILPYAPLHDRRTEIRWGMRDFEVRFGRPAAAIWFPETAVDLATLRVAAEVGVKGTVLAPWQADAAHIEARAYRVDVGDGRHLAVAFYDGDLSALVSFNASMTSDAEAFAHYRVAPRLAMPLTDGTPPTIVIASDGELYGHHQHFRDLFLRALVDPSPTMPDRGFDIVTLASLLEERDGHAGRRPCGARWTAWRGRSTRSPTGRRRICPGSTTSGPHATATSTSCSDWRAPTTMPRPVSARAVRPRSGSDSPKSSRPSAGAWRCSPRTAGTGTTPPAPRRRRTCSRRPARCDSWTASPARASSTGWSRTSRSCARPHWAWTAPRSTAMRSPRWGSRRRASDVALGSARRPA